MRRKGLGATGLQTGITSGGSIAGTVVGSVIGGPVGGLVGAGIGVAANAIASLFTPDYTKIYASNDANIAGDKLNRWLASWKTLDSSKKVPAVQQYYVQVWNAIWNGLVQACSDPSLGKAGENCITERSPGGKYDMSLALNFVQTDPVVHPQTSDVSFNDPLTGQQITIYNPQPSLVGAANNFAGGLISAVESDAEKFGISAGMLGIGILGLLLIL